MHLRLFRAGESRNSLCKYSCMNSRNVVIYPWHQFDLINGGTLTSLSRVRTWLVWILNSVVGLLEYGKRPEWAASSAKPFWKKSWKGFTGWYTHTKACVYTHSFGRTGGNFFVVWCCIKELKEQKQREMVNMLMTHWPYHHLWLCHHVAWEVGINLWVK
jgi:hypothetical protein